MRRLVTLLTLIALSVLVVWAAMWGWRSLLADLPGNPLTASEPTPACRPVHVDAGGRLHANQVVVSVFNTGARQGLASQTLDALMERGFVGGEVGNAPDIDVRRAQVWSRNPADPRALLVARQFGPSMEVRVTKRNLGDGVDVVLGDRFQHLSKGPRAITVRKAQSFCVPVASAG